MVLSLAVLPAAVALPEEDPEASPETSVQTEVPREETGSSGEPGSEDAAETNAASGQGGEAEDRAAGDELPPPAPLPSGAFRLSGKDRYATAVAVSSFGYPNGSNWVVLVSGTGYADALSAAPLAAAYRAPLLLTAPQALPAAALAEIKRLQPHGVIIVGGAGAVSAGIATQLSQLGPQVTRLSGKDRYATSARIAEFGWTAAAPDAFVTTGAGFADALAAAPAAARLGGPVLLVPPRNGASLTAAKQTLTRLGTS